MYARLQCTHTHTHTFIYFCWVHLILLFFTWKSESTHARTSHHVCKTIYVETRCRHGTRVDHMCGWSNVWISLSGATQTVAVYDRRAVYSVCTLFSLNAVYNEMMYVDVDAFSTSDDRPRCVFILIFVSVCFFCFISVLFSAVIFLLPVAARAWLCNVWMCVCECPYGIIGRATGVHAILFVHF